MSTAAPKNPPAVGTIKTRKDGTQVRWTGKKWNPVPEKGTRRTKQDGTVVRWNGQKWVPVKNQTAATPTEPLVPELPALTAEELAKFTDLRQDYGQAYEKALVSYNQQMANLNLAADKMLNEQARAGYAGGQQLRSNLSEGGLGFSPMFLNRGMRDISNQIAAARAETIGERTSKQDALNQMLVEAEAARNLSVSRLDRDMALARSASLAEQAGQPLVPGTVTGGPAMPAPAAGGQQRPAGGQRPRTVVPRTTSVPRIPAVMAPRQPVPTSGPWGMGPPPTTRKRPSNISPTMRIR
jgi:hypothetical protein